MARAIRQIDATSLSSIKNELSLIGYNMAVLVPAAHILTVFQRNEPLRPNSYVTLDLSMSDITIIIVSSSDSLKSKLTGSILPDSSLQNIRDL